MTNRITPGSSSRRVKFPSWQMLQCVCSVPAGASVSLQVGAIVLPGLEKTFLEMFPLNDPSFLLCSNFQISHSFIAEVLLLLPTILNVFSCINPTQKTTCSRAEYLAREVNRDLVQVIEVSQDRQTGKELL